jgi:hypothetical protein
MKPIIRTTTATAAAGLLAGGLLIGCDGGDPAATTSRVGDGSIDAPARFEARAERYERSAHLRGLAVTHGTDDAPMPTDETRDDEFVPGSRHMPTR